ncbi:MAG: hypothetical protein H8Z69_04940 [Nanohaloarchaea archaeon]|nr:hypothetical protein [Candidatus Nanohaloarchaea archaeon]
MLMDLIRRKIVMFLGPDNLNVPDYFWIVALTTIVVLSLILKWRGPEVEGGIMDQV